MNYNTSPLVRLPHTTYPTAISLPNVHNLNFSHVNLGSCIPVAASTAAPTGGKSCTFQHLPTQQNAVTERCKLTEGQSPVVPCPFCKTRKEAPSSGGGRSAQTRRLQRQEPGHLLGTAQSQGPEPFKTLRASSVDRAPYRISIYLIVLNQTFYNIIYIFFIYSFIFSISLSLSLSLHRSPQGCIYIYITLLCIYLLDFICVFTFIYITYTLIISYPLRLFPAL